MGVFDSVYVTCPTCGRNYEFQSKAGDPCLRSFSLDTAPPDVLADVVFQSQHGDERCECNTRIMLEMVSVSQTRVAHEGSTERRHILEALRYLARQPCKPDNCGSVCLCPPCHARAGIETYDPGWTP